jgi:FRG domain
MLTSWETVLRSSIDASQKSITMFYRGHSKAAWKLLPTLGRVSKFACYKKIDGLETAINFDFEIRAGSLLHEDASDWTKIFAMQHHGLPTRILDWTESFTIALFFALRDATDDCAVWALDPFVLNEESFGNRALYTPSDLRGSYNEYFIEREKQLEGKSVAISPLRHNPRVFNQRSGFTLHENITDPLEDLFPKALTKITIPKDAIKDAKKFLKLSSINEFSLFPDLDGLSRELMSEYGIKYKKS